MSSSAQTALQPNRCLFSATDYNVPGMSARRHSHLHGSATASFPHLLYILIAPTDP
jgi:hypothetical protein